MGGYTWSIHRPMKKHTLETLLARENTKSTYQHNTAVVVVEPVVIPPHSIVQVHAARRVHRGPCSLIYERSGAVDNGAGQPILLSHTDTLWGRRDTPYHPTARYTRIHSYSAVSGVLPDGNTRTIKVRLGSIQGWRIRPSLWLRGYHIAHC